MPIQLSNVTFDTARSAFAGSTGVTSKAAPYLYNLTGHISQLTDNQYIFLPQGALLTAFSLSTDDSYDIRLYDIVKNVRLLDGVTSWITVSANEYWSVIYIDHMPPGVLSRKDFVINRVSGGGTIS